MIRSMRLIHRLWGFMIRLIMNEKEVFVLADTALKKVVDQIRDDQWDMIMPEEFATSSMPGKTITLREVILYHAYDDAWVPDMLAGKTMKEVGVDNFKGDLLGDNPKENFGAIVENAIMAAKKIEDLDMVVHCSFGDYKAREYFWQINMFRGLRARDIALIIGADAKLSEELVQGLWDEVEPRAEEWRSYGVFGPKVEVPEGSSLMDRLLGLTGRKP